MPFLPRFQNVRRKLRVNSRDFRRNSTVLLAKGNIRWVANVI